MRWRLLAIVSLGANLVLAGAWLAYQKSPSGGSGLPKLPSAESIEAAGRTNLVVRRQFFSWREVESPDYQTYIANLRYIGCPEQTIRDIIIADVNALFARRRANELVSSEQQWWRSEPDPMVVQAANEKAAALEHERRTLLSGLLGDNWETGDMLSLPRPTRPGILLDGPVLGILPTETKQAIQDINARSQEKMESYVQAQLREGKNPDPAELVKLRQQTRDELSRVLAPAQLEEYLLRYSQSANELRADLGQLRFFNTNPEEFRAIFRATDTLDQRIASLSGNDPNALQARKALEDERENAIRIALGTRRYEEYRLLHDPLYRDAVETAEQAGTPDAARIIYQANLATAAEQLSIAANTNLTSTQRSLALKQLELEQMTANALATGQEPIPNGPPAVPSVPRRTYVMRPGIPSR